MKVYPIPVSVDFRPQQQAFRYPGHNDQYDVEQDFLTYMAYHPELVAESSREADWSYLPIFWTRWHMQHDYARTGREELQAEARRALDGVGRAFTVCLYEDGPLVDIGETVLMTATRKPTTRNGVDIPTLCAPHPLMQRDKQYRASFVGRFHTNPCRPALAAALAHRTDVFVRDGNHGQQTFVETMAASYVALCPSGGSGSFRFYEAMQLGVVPLLIHDVDTRPFKHAIDWSGCSLYAHSAECVESLIDLYEAEELLEMGKRAKAVYDERLAYQKWCPNALEELACASV